MIAASVLAMYLTLTAPFNVMIDSCGYGIAAVLMQHMHSKPVALYLGS